MTMFDQDRSWEREGVVSLWLGDFASADAFDAYLEEHIGEDDDAPLNQFAADTGLNFYDTGFQEAHFNEAGALPIREFLAPFSYSSSFVEAAAAAAARAGYEEANALILLYNCAYDQARAAAGPVHFVGSFPYDRNAAPAATT